MEWMEDGQFSKIIPREISGVIPRRNSGWISWGLWWILEAIDNRFSRRISEGISQEAI